MALYRCAVCGSSRVVTETKQEGYNKSKGIAGMALFGLGGAVAGTSGNSAVYYHCAACGHTLNKCMDAIDKKYIDLYLCTPNDAASIIRLRSFKKEYPNIEWEEPKEKTETYNFIASQKKLQPSFSDSKVGEKKQVTAKELEERNERKLQEMKERIRNNNEKINYEDLEASKAQSCVCPVCKKNMSTHADTCIECGHPIRKDYFKSLYPKANEKETKTTKRTYLIKLWLLAQYLNMDVSDFPEEVRDITDWTSDNYKQLIEISEEDVKALTHSKDEHSTLMAFLEHEKMLYNRRKKS